MIHLSWQEERTSRIEDRIQLITTLDAKQLFKLLVEVLDLGWVLESRNFLVGSAWAKKLHRASTVPTKMWSAPTVFFQVKENWTQGKNDRSTKTRNRIRRKKLSITMKFFSRILLISIPMHLVKPSKLQKQCKAMQSKQLQILRLILIKRVQVQDKSHNKLH